jgi:glutaconate CoA-transferase subunit B
VVTEKAVLKFHETTKEMYLAEYYPGTAIEAVTAGIAFPIDTSRAVESAPPSDDELRILREEIDPQRLILE